ADPHPHAQPQDDQLHTAEQAQIHEIDIPGFAVRHSLYVLAPCRQYKTANDERHNNREFRQVVLKNG
ncbi:hypothetical protein, partial [Salmonella enterica]|uniref:hypothetical protein n=1 Tax=Salmonella enterica TaxID=28901 RepID=UPI0039F5F2A4